MLTFLPTGDIKLPTDYLDCGIDWKAVGGLLERVRDALDGFMMEVRALAQGQSDLLWDPDRHSEDPLKQLDYWEKPNKYYNDTAQDGVVALIDGATDYMEEGDGAMFMDLYPRDCTYERATNRVIKALYLQHDAIMRFVMDFSTCTDLPYYLNPTAASAQKLDLDTPVLEWNEL